VKRLLVLFLILFAFPVVGTASSDKDAQKSLQSQLSQYGGQSVSPEERRALEDSALNARDSGIGAWDVLRFIEVCGEAGRGAAEVSFYLDRMAELHGRGVPAELIMNIILEGVAKGVPEQNIRGSLGPLTERLIFCTDTARRSVTGHGARHSSDADVELLANGIFQMTSLGFRRNDVDLLSSAVRSSGQDPDYFLHVIEISMALVNTDLDRQSVLRLMTGAVEKGLSTSQLLMLPQAVSRLAAQRLSEERMIEEAMAAVQSSGGLQQDSGSRTSGSKGSGTGGSGSGGGGSGGHAGGGSGSGSGSRSRTGR
jgi:uncharacterized membrane protein YgcG